MIAGGIVIFRSNANRWRRIGNAARDRRDWATAEQAFAAYLKVRPHDCAIWVQLGHSRKEQRDLAGARTAYDRAIELGPDVADSWVQLGHILTRPIYGAL